ncbi:MAG: hypothetical protein U0694_13115 [Anaerolineae bacterium]
MPSEQTDQYFAWTIAAPITAAALGAGYWAALVPTVVGISGRSWANIRSIVVIGFSATLMMLITTLLHLDKFHHTAPVSLPWFAAWVWILVYVLSPLLFLSLLISQMRTGGDNAPRVQPVPGIARAIGVIQALFGLAVGLALFVLPESFGSQWLWTLTPLTSRALGAWMTASGIAAACVVWENDLPRARGTLYGLLAFGVLELIVVARYTGAVSWSNTLAWAYVIYMASHVLLSLALLWYGRKRDA